MLNPECLFLQFSPNCLNREYYKYYILMMKNKVLLFTGIFCSLVTNLYAGRKNSVKNEKRSPNVIFILTDDQGYADISCYGAKVKTPHIDRMAEMGMRFTDFYAGANLSTPSRAALMTGCYPARVNLPNVIFPDDKVCLNTNEFTLAEMFLSAGYYTGMVGKWHLGAKGKGLPLNHGFNEFYGLHYSHDMVNGAFKGDIKNPNLKLDRNYPDLPLYKNDKIEELNPDPASLTSRYTEYCMDFIKRNRENPFFLYLAYNMPHVPLAVSDKWSGKSGQGIYSDIITEIDWSIGQIYEVLKENDIAENTLVIYTSDNGPALIYGNHAGSAGNLHSGKGSVYDGGHRVHCLMTWPKVIPSGKVCTKIATILDILPTMATYLDVPLSKNKIDGKNIISLMRGEKSISLYDTYFYFRGKVAYAVRCGDWKLILSHNERKVKVVGKNGLKGINIVDSIPKSLFNIRKDIGENDNLINKYPKKAAQMERLILDFNKEIEAENRSCGRVNDT